MVERKIKIKPQQYVLKGFEMVDGESPATPLKKNTEPIRVVMNELTGEELVRRRREDLLEDIEDRASPYRR